MKSSEVFGVVVRSVGLVVVMLAAWALCWTMWILVLGGSDFGVGLFVNSIAGLLIGGWLLRGAPALVEFAYQTDENRSPRRAAAARQFGPQIVTAAANELEAATIIAALAERGIEASTTGEYTTGFRAEAPGWGNIVVWHQDLDRARQVIAEIKSGVDWSKTDVGEPEG